MKLNIHAHIWNITAISDKHFQLSIHKSWVGIGQPRFVHATNYCIAQHSLCVWLSSDRRVHCVSKARVAPGVFRWKYIHSGHFCMFMVCTHKHDMHTCSLTGSRNFHPGRYGPGFHKRCSHKQERILHGSEWSTEPSQTSKNSIL